MSTINLLSSLHCSCKRNTAVYYIHVSTYLHSFFLYCISLKEHIQGCNFLSLCYHLHSGNLVIFISATVWMCASRSKHYVFGGFMRACGGPSFLFVSYKFTDNICFSLNILAEIYLDTEAYQFRPLNIL